MSFISAVRLASGYSLGSKNLLQLMETLTDWLKGMYIVHVNPFHYPDGVA